MPIRYVDEAEMVEALVEEVERFEQESEPLASFVEKEKQRQKSALPVLG